MGLFNPTSTYRSLKLHSTYFQQLSVFHVRQNTGNWLVIIPSVLHCHIRFLLVYSLGIAFFYRKYDTDEILDMKSLKILKNNSLLAGLSVV